MASSSETSSETKHVHWKKPGAISGVVPRQYTALVTREARVPWGFVTQVGVKAQLDVRAAKRRQKRATKLTVRHVAAMYKDEKRWRLELGTRTTGSGDAGSGSTSRSSVASDHDHSHGEMSLARGGLKLPLPFGASLALGAEAVLGSSGQVELRPAAFGFVGAESLLAAMAAACIKLSCGVRVSRSQPLPLPLWRGMETSLRIEAGNTHIRGLHVGVDAAGFEWAL